MSLRFFCNLIKFNFNAGYTYHKYFHRLWFDINIWYSHITGTIHFIHLIGSVLNTVCFFRLVVTFFCTSANTMRFSFLPFCFQTYGSGNLKRVGVILQRGVLILLLACFPCWALLINTQSILLAVKQSTQVARWPSYTNQTDINGTYTLITHKVIQYGFCTYLQSPLFSLP